MANPVLEKIAETWYGVSRGGFSLSAGAPHLRDGMDIKRYMISVILALSPALTGGIIAFGPRVLLLLLVSYLSGGAVEVAFAVIRKRPVEEGFLVTGLIFALTLPPALPLWIAALGIAFGTFFGKELFGGTGRNVFNPALVGRLFITISFPAIFAVSYSFPGTGAAAGAAGAAGLAGTTGVDALSFATPLTAWFRGDACTLQELLFAAAPGAFGEVSRFLLVLGGLWLISVRIADWRIPLSYLGGFALLTFLLRLADPSLAPPVPYSLLSGGLILGAFFMATDPVTSPVSRWGKVFHGLSCAILTLLFRSFSSYTEGVMFAIILSNALAPLFDEAVFAVRFPHPEVSKRLGQLQEMVHARRSGAKPEDRGEREDRWDRGGRGGTYR